MPPNHPTDESVNPANLNLQQQPTDSSPSASARLPRMAAVQTGFPSPSSSASMPPTIHLPEPKEDVAATPAMGESQFAIDSLFFHRQILFNKSFCFCWVGYKKYR